MTVPFYIPPEYGSVTEALVTTPISRSPPRNEDWSWGQGPSPTEQGQAGIAPMMGSSSQVLPEVSQLNRSSDPVISGEGGGRPEGEGSGLRSRTSEPQTPQLIRDRPYFLQRLFSELSSVYAQVMTVGEERGQGGGSRNVTGTTSGLIPNSSRSHPASRAMGHNMGSTRSHEQAGDISSPSFILEDSQEQDGQMTLTLPDLIKCHGLLSMDLLIESRTTFRPRSAVNPSQAPMDPHDTPSISISMDSQGLEMEEYGTFSGDDDEEENNWSLEFKVALGPWRQVGRDLRRIADQFTVENTIRRSSNPRAKSTSFHLRLTVPTIAILGAILSAACVRGFRLSR